jgi:hypothetical protein
MSSPVARHSRKKSLNNDSINDSFQSTINSLPTINRLFRGAVIEPWQVFEDNDSEREFRVLYLNNDRSSMRALMVLQLCFLTERLIQNYLDRESHTVLGHNWVVTLTFLMATCIARYFSACFPGHGMRKKLVLGFLNFLALWVYCRALWIADAAIQTPEVHKQSACWMVIVIRSMMVELIAVHASGFIFSELIFVLIGIVVIISVSINFDFFLEISKAGGEYNGNSIAGEGSCFNGYLALELYILLTMVAFAVVNFAKVSCCVCVCVFLFVC